MTYRRLSVDCSKCLANEPHSGHNRWHPDIPPRIEISDGETIGIETRDALDCQIGPHTTNEDVRNVSIQRIHPLTGPVYVKGAEPGDLLAVHIKEVIPRSTGFTLIMPGFGFLRDIFTEPHIVHWTMKDGYAYSDQLPGVRIPGAPFMGVMGLAPSAQLMAEITEREARLHEKGGAVLLPNAEMAVPSTGPAALHGLPTCAPHEVGGNLDIKQLVAGTTLYLPVYQPGALFSTGDAHFAQGDGETCGTAVETSATLVAQFQLLKGEAKRRKQRDPSFGREMAMPRPQETQQRFYATTGMCLDANGENRSEDLSLSARNALINMLDHICDRYGFTRQQAHSLASVAVNLRISQVVDVPNLTVSAFLPLDIFEG